MKWNVIRIRTTNDVTDYLAGILFDLGFDGIEVTDTVQLSEQEKKRQKEDAQAFDQLVNYGPEIAYGLHRTEDIYETSNKG